VGEYVGSEECDTHLRTMSMALMDEFMTSVHESNCVDLQSLLAFQRSWIDAKIAKLEQEAELSADLVFLTPPSGLMLPEDDEEEEDHLA